MARVGRNWFEIEGDTPIHNGDGLSYFNAGNELVGLRVNRAEGRRLFPAEMDFKLAVGTPLYRNRDQEFERQLEKKSAERRIRVRMRFSETPEGFALEMTDEEGISASAALPLPKEPAQNAERAFAAIREQMGKLGNTLFTAEAIGLDLAAPWFIPASNLNALRREAAEKLEAARLSAYQRPPNTRKRSSPISATSTTRRPGAFTPGTASPSWTPPTSATGSAARSR